MAEEDSGQEKTEEATPRKREKAREEGQVPRSKELATTSVLLLSSVALLIFGQLMATSMAEIFRYNFSLPREAAFDSNLLFKYLGYSFYEALLALLPFFAVVVVAAIAGPIAISGWLFSFKSLAPKFNRLDPIKGIGRMFSVKALMELLKSIIKVSIVIGCAFVILSLNKQALMALASESLMSAIVHSVTLSVWAAILLSVSTIVIALIDIPYQIHDHSKKLKMSHQDVRDEMKETEGKPEVKSKIRQMQFDMAQRRMMSAVPEADVIITNPSHFSIALKYDPDTMETPELKAKGVDMIALKIREVAKEHNIEVLESPVLARAIYHTTEIDQPIPQGLYLAVAQVLAYVFQLRQFRKGRGERPLYPRNLDIPKEMRHY